MPIDDNLITLSNFCIFIQQNDGFLKPLFQLQDKFHRTILNKKFWKETAQRKVVLGLGRRVVLGNVLVEVRNVNDVLYDVLMYLDMVVVVYVV